MELAAFCETHTTRKKSLEKASLLDYKLAGRCPRLGRLPVRHGGQERPHEAEWYDCTVWSLDLFRNCLVISRGTDRYPRHLASLQPSVVALAKEAPGSKTVLGGGWGAVRIMLDRLLAEWPRGLADWLD